MRHLLLQIQKLILRHEDSLNILKSELAYVLFLRLHIHCSAAGSLYQAQSRWRRIPAR